MASPHDETEPQEIADFRSEVRAWIAANAPGDPGFKLPQSFLEVESQQQFEYLLAWQQKVYAAGYLGLDWPAEYGGKGRPGLQRIVSQEMGRAGTPFFVNTIGLQWAGPTILHYGTEAQKKRYLEPILSGAEIWCQGFSEPGSGSDLASVTTSAVRSGDDWLVNGHKVWTTLGQQAKWMILLARTDPSVGKYDGLSYFLLPMDAPGVTVQPLVKMSGEGGFNQVIFEDVPMPGDALLGELGQGWQVAMTTLTHERGAAEGSGGGQLGGGSESVRALVALAKGVRRDGAPAAADPVLRDRIADLWIREEALRLGGLRGRVPALCGDRPMALALMNKVVFSELAQEIADVACQLEGPAAQLYVGDPDAPDHAEWPRAYLNSFGMTIGGGTSEIQRNILGERVLGLPKSK